MCTIVSCRGSPRPKENCPIAISDIVLLHNHVMQILAPKQIEKEIWDVCPASLKVAFVKYFKVFDKRLETMDPQYRILPVDEAISTTVSVPGFVLEFHRRKVMAEQKSEDFKLELQFLQHHRDNYLKQCADFSECEYSPKTRASLESFKALLLSEAAILLGWDLEWRPSPQQNSGAPVGSAISADAVLPNATSADDNSSSDADKAPGKAASPVFGPTGWEPPPAVPDASAPPDAPGAQDSDDVPIFAAGGLRTIPVNISDNLTWSPDNWNEINFSSIKLPGQGEHLATLRTYFAIAILLYYQPALQAKHAEFYELFKKSWVDTFMREIDDKQLEKPPSEGALGFSPDQVTWLMETRRLLTDTGHYRQRKSCRVPVARTSPSHPATAKSRSKTGQGSSSAPHSQGSSSAAGDPRTPEKKGRNEDPVKHNSRCNVSPKRY